MSSHCDICAFSCFGQKGNYASCCSIEERNWIMGPILDYEKVLSDLSEKYGREVTFKEVFYDFDEGSKTFSARKVWQDPNNFPAMRIDFSTPKKTCVFYNENLKVCSIYEIRPETCKNYFCDYLERELLMNQ